MIWLLWSVTHFHCYHHQYHRPPESRMWRRSQFRAERLDPSGRRWRTGWRWLAAAFAEHRTKCVEDYHKNYHLTTMIRPGFDQIKSRCLRPIYITCLLCALQCNVCGGDQLSCHPWADRCLLITNEFPNPLAPRFIPMIGMQAAANHLQQKSLVLLRVRMILLLNRVESGQQEWEWFSCRPPAYYPRRCCWDGGWCTCS